MGLSKTVSAAASTLLIALKITVGQDIDSVLYGSDGVVTPGKRQKKAKTGGLPTIGPSTQVS